MRRELDHELAFEQRLADQPKVEVLQVAKAAVDHLRRAARGPDRVVVTLDQRHRIATRGGVERHSGAGDAAADDDDVEALRCDRLQCVFAAEHLIEVGDDGFDRLALGRGLLLDRMTEIQQRDEALVGPEPDRGPSLGGAKDARGAPVADQPAGMRGKQDDVGGDRRRVQVLLIGDLVAALRRGADDEGRRAIELRRRLRARGLLEALESARGRRRGNARGWSGGGLAPTARARRAHRGFRR